MSGLARRGHARGTRCDGSTPEQSIRLAALFLVFSLPVYPALPRAAHAQGSGVSTQDAFSQLESSAGSRKAGAFPFDYQHLVFYPSAAGEVDLWTAVSVHAGRVRGVFEGGWKYELELRTIIYRDGEEIARDESRVRHLLNALIPPRTTDGFPIQTRVRVLPGEYRYRIEVRDLNWEGDRALNVQEGEVVVPPFDRTGPFVSSVAVAADSGGAWSPSPGVELKLNAAKMVQTDARPFVYFEVYGLTPGETHRGEVRLVSNWAPMGKGETFTGVRQPFQLQYRGTTPDEPERPVRSVLRLEMKDTRPGPYKVLVRFTDAATGEKTEVRATEIRVRDPEDRGAEQPIAEVGDEVRGGR
ncbi:MAG: hypothetical protein M8857_01230 [marine benthic group bacterium]|nr:hypothetical protein [Gemmatimonadota bacterium]